MANRRNRAAVEDCLKVIFSVGEWDPEARTVGEIATRMHASTSTVSDLVRRLTDEGLVKHERYGGVDLTAAGLREALTMVRRHRLIETYLVTALGYRWDEVHDEAEVLEHAISDLMLDRMDRSLGRPWRDPHGDAIPTPDGLLHLPDAVPLAACEVGASGFVVRILDEDPELLRWFAEHGVVLDAAVTVRAHKPFGGAVEVEVGGTAGPIVVDLGVQAVTSLWIAPTPAHAEPSPTGCHYPRCRHLGGGEFATPNS